MIDELLPFVEHAYTEMGKELKAALIRQTTTVDFFPGPQMKLAFESRYSEKDAQYLARPGDENKWKGVFNYDFGYGEIDPCYLVDLQTLLPAWRNRLLAAGQLREERFDTAGLKLHSDGISYDGIKAKKIIFCDGVNAGQSTWFRNLPFAPNKGEVLWIDAPELPAHSIFKKNIVLAPWAPGIFWVGSSYEWDFPSDLPTDSFREKTTAQLKNWLRVPFQVIDHKAAVRPATLERRPFVGLHPQFPSLGIFNGMGTKGCSLAPYFARQLAKHIKDGSPINPEVDINRFSRILAR